MVDNSLEKNILNEIVSEYIREKRQRRRWGIFFRFIFAALFLLTLITLYTSRSPTKTRPHTSMIDLSGAIFSDSPASADNIAKGLRMAFDDSNTVGIILRINSPGGSPVDAHYVFNEILRLKKLHPKIKIYAVCTDMCASAAYYIASATDEIYSDPASLVGSIGVLYDGFGFVGTLQKLGIERRVVTAGKNKAFMDPFSPTNEYQQNLLKKMLNEVHQQFIKDVQLGRGKRLSNNPEIFSGLFWTGMEAKQLGLVDHFGSPGFVAREVIKNEKIVDYTVKDNYFERFARYVGSGMTGELAARIGWNQTGMKSLF